MNRKFLLFIICLVGCQFFLLAQIQKKQPPPPYQNAIERHLRYPDDLAGEKSGYVVCQIATDDKTNFYPVFIYSTHTDFSQAVMQSFAMLKPEQHFIIEAILGETIVVEFITHTYPEHKKIAPDEENDLLNSLGVNKNTIKVKNEAFIGCRKRSL